MVGVDRRTGIDRRDLDQAPSNLEAGDLGKALPYFDLRSYDSGDSAVNASARDTTLFVIHSGRFEVLVPSDDGFQSAGYLRQGDIFGELSFFDHEARSADIRAVEKSESLVLTPESFARMQSEQPQLAIELLLKIGAVASRRFRAHNRKLAAVGMIAPHMAW